MQESQVATVFRSFVMDPSSCGSSEVCYYRFKIEVVDSPENANLNMPCLELGEMQIGNYSPIDISLFLPVPLLGNDEVVVLCLEFPGLLSNGNPSILMQSINREDGFDGFMLYECHFPRGVYLVSDDVEKVETVIISVGNNVIRCKMSIF